VQLKILYQTTKKVKDFIKKMLHLKQQCGILFNRGIVVLDATSERMKINEKQT